MSYTGVHKITADGTVESVGDVSNSHGWCMHIWCSLNAKYRVGCWTFAFEPLWKLFGTKRLSERDSIVLGATFDAVWVKQSDIPRLVAALESFWAEHSTVRDRLDGAVHTVSPTIPGVVAHLKAIASDETARGACFYATSITDDPWYGENTDERDGYDESSRFVFGKDTVTRHGAPWELFANLHEEQAKSAPAGLR